MIALPHPESPTVCTKTPHFLIHEEDQSKMKSPSYRNRKLSPGIKRTNSTADFDQPVALTTSKLANQQTSIICSSVPIKKLDSPRPSNDESQRSSVDLVMSLLMSEIKDDESSSYYQPKTKDTSMNFKTQSQLNPETQENTSEKAEVSPSNMKITENRGSEVDIIEFNRIKQELEAANEKLAFIGHQAIQVPENDLSTPSIGRSEIILPFREKPHIVQKTEVTPPNYDMVVSRPQPKYLEAWPSADDATLDRSIQFSPVPFETCRRSWSGTSMNSDSVPQAPTIGGSRWNSSINTPWSNRYNNSSYLQSGHIPAPQPRRTTALRIGSIDRSMQQSIGNSSFEQTFRQTDMLPSRPTSTFQTFNAWNSHPAVVTSGSNFSPPMTPSNFQSMNMHAPVYQPQPIGTPLSATAMEFNAPWNPQPAETMSSYVQSAEPMNYRRLLDRNMSCNWKFIVDKIVCNNDQQASIFLQQKLKVAAPEQKFEMVDAVITQAYPLMINRFGNFLIQRCFEHGTPEQVIAIANTIRGNTLALSMDAFGCHVVQKAFDVVPEDYKAIMVHELLRRIPETVIHRHACHVWQKLFELRWSDSPPQIMKYVNEALRGMWHEVALGETGSLVVQNIFENCLEEDKRPCVNEVLASIDIISHGQFGNWCIQHICEHGALVDRGRATEHVLRFATEYSMDQFASKVIEKCLKVGGVEFLERYLNKVCEARSDRPRMPLIDIAGDQYGNYLVQWILISAAPQHREIVVNHVRKHMVSLRGSKFGSRVAMLCCNTSFAARPGPSASTHNNRYMPTSSLQRSNFGQYR